jgi:hypothetical protein
LINSSQMKNKVSRQEIDTFLEQYKEVFFDDLLIEANLQLISNLYDELINEIPIPELSKRQFPPGVSVKEDASGNVTVDYIFNPRVSRERFNKRYEGSFKLKQYWRDHAKDILSNLNEIQRGKRIKLKPSIFGRCESLRYDDATDKTIFDDKEYLTRLHASNLGIEFIQELIDENRSLDYLEWLLGLRVSTMEEAKHSLGYKEQEVLLKIFQDSNGTADSVPWHPSYKWLNELPNLNRKSETANRSRAKWILADLEYVTRGRNQILLTATGLELAIFLTDSLTDLG